MNDEGIRNSSTSTAGQGGTSFWMLLWRCVLAGGVGAPLILVAIYAVLMGSSVVYQLLSPTPNVGRFGNLATDIAEGNILVLAGTAGMAAIASAVVVLVGFLPGALVGAVLALVRRRVGPMHPLVWIGLGAALGGILTTAVAVTTKSDADVGEAFMMSLFCTTALLPSAAMIVVFRRRLGLSALTERQSFDASTAPPHD